ncbi:Aste57867_6923 [Aphanomyces stellatus]|uniref:Aste57867_6923 protein n=1 Tax=Aphanomyces stellatus TaxID=120398 RepID=A0A485KG66_9STRA|nr:hypothetical protein As57867_006901 [Aphanomyces stellatus]VFT83875.1 Aste57867_6923 [Aphanomyces stellatus]
MLDLSTLFSLLAVVVAVAIYRKASGPVELNAHIPFISSWVPFFGASWQFRHGRQSCLQRWTAQYGPVFRLTLLGKPVTYITDASLFSPLVKTAALTLYPLKAKILERVFGAAEQQDMDALAFMAKLARQNLLTHLSGGSLSQWTTKSQAIFGAQLAAVFPTDAVGGPTTPPLDLVVVYPWLAARVVTTMVETFYGPGLCTPEFIADIDRLDKAFNALFIGIPAKWKKVDTVRDRLLASVHQFVPAHLADVTPFVRDHWQNCASKNDEANDTSAARDQCAHQLSFIWAMIYNTTRTTFWLLYHLQQAPRAWTAVLDEVHLHVQGEKPISDEVQSCVLLESAILETLRISSSAGSFRVAVDETIVDLPNGTRLHVRKGDQVVLQSSVGCHDPGRFPNPSTFQFDRFATTPALAADFRPFGHGKFQCPGQFFAMDFIKMAMAMLMLEMDISDFAGTAEPEFSTPGVFAPKVPTGATMLIRKRSSATVA